jgi:16S rRNA (adenine1518-N6/adenine1519-N6)-dimethyltransferase
MTDLDRGAEQLHSNVRRQARRGSESRGNEKNGGRLSDDPDVNARHVGHRAKRSLGQNFLTDANIARKIVNQLSILAGDTVLEIGPGKGALTRLLVERCTHLIAVEKDYRLFDSLRSEFKHLKLFELINEDFLDYNFNSSDGTVKVVGNIPYNLTSQIVSRLVDLRSRIDSAVLMVQKEVADRLASVPATKSYGAISVRLQLTGHVKKLFLVPPTCFHPEPKVDSRVVRISFHRREPLRKEGEFVTFVKKAFGMRRKMIRHFISHYYGKSALSKIGESFQIKRIESLPPEDIYNLFLILEKND